MKWKYIQLLICQASLFLLFKETSLAQEEIEIKLEPVVITGSRLPNTDNLRTITIINNEEIKKSSGWSVNDLLDISGGVDLKRRGMGEIQGDLSIRGSSFEQVLIMVDGIPINDPQTGHHDLHLPFCLDNIEQIEIYHGAGSSFYGTDALGGVVNFITRPPSTHFSTAGRIYGGFFPESSTYTTFGGTAQVSHPLFKGGIKLTAGGESSAGYIEGTDYQLGRIFSQIHQNLSGIPLNLAGGYLNKNFGARNFYGSRPGWEPWEEIKTLVLTFHSEFKVTPYFQFQPRMLFRHNHDYFTLFRHDPERYQNHHETSTIYGSLESTLNSNTAGNLAISLVSTGDWLKSSNLGNHEQSRNSLAFEYLNPHPSSWKINPSFRLDLDSRVGVIYSPALRIGLSPTPEINLRAASGMAHRAPTFTELYYSDPANHGNPELEIEKSLTAETGIDYKTNPHFLQTSLTLFLRKDWNLIDWARENADQPWQALNLGEILTLGSELNTTIALPRNINLRGSYSLMNQRRKDPGLELKYSSIYPQHRLTFALYGKIIWKLEPYLALEFQNRNYLDNLFLINFKLSRSLRNFLISLEGKNLTDEKYEEIRGVTQPGRYLGSSISFKWD